MRTSVLLSVLLSFLLLAVRPAAANETDQFNLPPVPLADIGDEVTSFIWDNIFDAAARINGEIDRHEACLNGTAPKGAKCQSNDVESKKLAELRSDDALVKAVYQLLGHGTVLQSPTGDWLTAHHFSHQPARFKADYAESIYLVRPANYATLSPTIRVNGVDMGTDKFDHFFQEGYRYLKIYQRERSKGKTPEEARKKAVSWGRMTEKTYFGYLVSGVFSNADLFANFAGMKFYLNLTHPVAFGDTTRPALLSVVDGKWQVNTSTPRTDLLKPFIADQMNEALNPSGFLPLLYSAVRSAVKKNACPKWRSSFPALTKSEIETRTKALETWNGEDYGFSRRSKMATLADTCFAD
jgi:hypothetical protein